MHLHYTNSKIKKIKSLWIKGFQVQQYLQVSYLDITYESQETDI